MTNQIHELLKNHYGNDSYDEIVSLINELKDYTIYHFETEENLLKKYDYKDLKEHIVEHTSFIDYLNALDLYTIDDKQEQALKDLLLFVTKWILKHITNTDFKYSLYIQNALSNIQ